MSSSAAVEHEQREAAAKEKQPPPPSHRGAADSLATAAGATELGAEGASKGRGPGEQDWVNRPKTVRDTLLALHQHGHSGPFESKFKKEPALTAGRLLGFEANGANGSKAGRGGCGARALGEKGGRRAEEGGVLSIHHSTPAQKQQTPNFLICLRRNQCLVATCSCAEAAQQR